MEYINTPNAPQPAGHYSQATVHNDLVFVSGQLPIKAGTGEKVLGSIQEQTEQVLENLKAILDAAGSGMDQVLKVTIYISDISLWGGVNEVYGKHFGDHKPARAVIPCKELHYGFSLELEAVAVRYR